MLLQGLSNKVRDGFFFPLHSGYAFLHTQIRGEGTEIHCNLNRDYALGISNVYDITLGGKGMHLGYWIMPNYPVVSCHNYVLVEHPKIERVRRKGITDSLDLKYKLKGMQVYGYDRTALLFISSTATSLISQLDYHND